MDTSIVHEWMQSMEKMSRWVNKHSIRLNSILILTWFHSFLVDLLCWLRKHRIRYIRHTIRMGHNVQCHCIPSGPVQIGQCSGYVRFSKPKRTRLHLQQLFGKTVRSARFVSANLKDSINSRTKWERQIEMHDFLHIDLQGPFGQGAVGQDENCTWSWYRGRNQRKSFPRMHGLGAKHKFNSRRLKHSKVKRTNLLKQ